MISLEEDLCKEIIGVKKPILNPGRGGWFGDGVKRPTKKKLVEDSIVLSSLALMKKGVLRRLDEKIISGELIWGDEIERIRFESCPWHIKLQYNMKKPNHNEYENISHTVLIDWEEKGRPKDNYVYFNPIFICPSKDNKLCETRTYNLYRPPGEELYLCRKCHNLSYRSEQNKTEREARKYFKAVGLL